MRKSFSFYTSGAQRSQHHLSKVFHPTQFARNLTGSGGSFSASWVFHCIAAAVGVVLLAGCGSEAGEDHMPPPPAVSVAVMEIRDVVHWDEFTGRVEAVESVELHPRVSGYIERVNYREGGHVNKGDVLFVIDQRTYQAALARAQAAFERAETQAKLARTEAERAQRLVQSRAISSEELEQRLAALAQAQAQVRSAQAELDVAQLEMEFTEVRAPISGRAGRALVTAGNLVSTQPNATLLTTIVSTDPVHVYFEGDQRAFQRYQGQGSDRVPSNPVRVGLAGEPGYPHEGMMDFMDNQIDPRTGTLRARAVLPNRDGKFAPGLFARVQLLDDRSNQALLIDEKAVLTDQDRQYVYIVDDQGRALRRDVQLGRKVDDLRVVLSGLAEGEQVIVHGVQKVFFPGMPVAAHLIAMGDPPSNAQAPASAMH